MKEPKISLIVPVYNAKEYLPRCVDSLIGQTYKNLEILLIDDGSTDGAGSLCDSYEEKDSRIRVIHKANSGLVSAWKRGVAESCGEYLCFVDGDDWISPSMLEEMVCQLKGIDREMIACDYQIERPTGAEAVYQSLPPGEYDRTRLETEVFPKLLGNENRTVTFSRCMKLISRKLMVDNQRYSDENLRMGEDLAVVLPAILDCERLVILDKKAYYHYFYNIASMVHGYDSGLYENIRLLRSCIEQILQDKFAGDGLAQMQRRANQEYLFLLLLVLKNEARGNREGYRENILSICRQEEVVQLCKKVPIQVELKANRLLYLTLRHPSQVTVRLLRLAMLIYYRK